MRTISLLGTDLTPAPLGMGCASLGSRYSATAGLRALAAAADNGVTWFDVAPAYGGGEAEEILGRFLRGRREQLQLCTKVGLIPPRQGLARRLLTPIARPLIGRLKSMRSAVRLKGSNANIRVPLTPELIETSIIQSLRRLGTDRVEVYALHNPTLEELTRDDILRALERVISRGQARYLGVAGDLAVALAGAAGGHFQVAQLAENPVELSSAQVRATGPTAIITHSILGIGGAYDLLAKGLKTHPNLMAEAEEAGFSDPATLLMARAFATNPNGVVLASMFGSGNLEANIFAAEMPQERARLAESLVARTLTELR